MPVYNGGPYLERALQSVLTQTWDNYEIIIVNDGSNDGGHTDAVARQYRTNYPEQIGYFPQENGGVASALNRGVRVMSGDVFCWLSHDDLFEPHKLASQVRFHNDLGRSDAILFSDYRLIGPEGDVLNEVRIDHAAALASPRLALLRGWINGCTIFIPAGLLKARDSPFDPQYRHVQDYRLWHDLLQQHEFFHQPELLVRYRVHGGQDSQKPEAVAEGDRLWVDMLEATTPAIRAQLSGSSWRFYGETLAHLQDSAYVGAAALSKAKRDTCGVATVVSIIVSAAGPALVRTLASLLGQTHRAVDILVVVPPEAEDGWGEARSTCHQDDRVRVLHSAGLEEGLRQALRAARGEYLGWIEAGHILLPEKLERQLDAMQRAGALICHTSYLTAAAAEQAEFRVAAGELSGWIPLERVDDGTIEQSTVLVHRLLVAEGFGFYGSPRDALRDACMRRPMLGLDDALTLGVSKRLAHLAHGLARPITANRQGEPRKPYDLAPFQNAARPPPPVACRVQALLQALQAERELVGRRPRLVDLKASTHSVKDRQPADGRGLRFATGAVAWDYAAVIHLDRHSSPPPDRIRVSLSSANEAVFVLLVDEAYNQIGTRQGVPPNPIPTVVWLDAPAWKGPTAVVVQAGAAPLGTTIEIDCIEIYGR